MELFYQHLNNYLFLIPLIPLVAFAINGIFGSYLSRGVIHFIGVFSVFLSFCIAVLALYRIAFDPVYAGQVMIFSGTMPWISSDSLYIPWGLFVDQLSAVMIMIVTGVGFLIHLYSIGYMQGDPGVHKFFAYMNLFTASMLVLVMADNLILMFLGWEGVGLCSYLLIAFWYENKEFAAAGKKAFIFNRIGDAGFILGGILLFWTFGTLSFISYDTHTKHIKGLPEALESATTYITEEGSLKPVYDKVSGLPQDRVVPLVYTIPERIDSIDYEVYIENFTTPPQQELLETYYHRDEHSHTYQLSHSIDEQSIAEIYTLLSSIQAYTKVKDEWVLRTEPVEAHLDLPSRFLGIPFAVVMLIVTLLLFLGATGKSAQIPLYTWLPDAMAGPTPVSALIHAATMVTAGVYMIGRLFYLFELAVDARLIIVLVGGITSVLAGMIAVSQNDIKKILAYSTISQLGYMFMAMAAGVYALGIFHVTTHAFFKALLFLGAGSVILAMHHEQDITKMGGLARKIPITFVTFMIGALALTGIAPFAGFFSKDQILEGVFFEYHPLIWGLGILSAVFTAMYTWRLMGMTFFGQRAITEDGPAHQHTIRESSKTILFVLVVLAGLSLVGGFMGLPAVFAEHNHFAEFLAPVLGLLPHPADAGVIPIVLMLVSLGVAMGFGLLFWLVYRNRDTLSGRWVDSSVGRVLYQLSYHKFYVDEVYHLIITRPFEFLSGVFWKVVDQFILQRVLLDGVGFVVKKIGNGFRTLQVGNVNGYAMILVLGVLAILAYLLYIILCCG
jgi:proton-translocating NADH-quinone oxidoreductase chain L